MAFVKMTPTKRKREALGSKASLPFSSFSTSIRGAAVHTEPSVSGRTRPWETHRASFHTSPTAVKQKIAKIVSKTRELPNPLVRSCGRVRLDSVGESRSHTRPDRCIALERQKDAPRGFDGIRKSLSRCPPFLFPS